jgi:tripartite-type tricarboxylate transporter receptor subunit TctC
MELFNYIERVHGVHRMLHNECCEPRRRRLTVLTGLSYPRSLPGLTRQSIILRKWMDARVKPAHDAGESGALRALLVHRLVLPGLLLAYAASASLAGSFPGNNVVRIVVPTLSGPPPDVIARIIATEIAESEGWRVIVDNRPGALQTLAMADVLNKPADGLSIFPMSLGAIATPALLPEKGLRLHADFAPVVKIATGYTVLVVPPSLPATTLAELVALLKAQPDKLNYSAGGFGTPAHLLGEMFRRETGTLFTQVQYPQTQQRMADLLSGRTQLGFINTPVAVDLVASGKLRALAIAGPKRIASFVDVPTVIEAGFPNLVAEDWVGFVVKTGTPGEAIARLNAAVNAALAKPKVRAALASLGYEPAGGSAAALGDLIVAQATYWAKVVSDAGIKMPQ